MSKSKIDKKTGKPYKYYCNTCEEYFDYLMEMDVDLLTFKVCIMCLSSQWKCVEKK